LAAILAVASPIPLEAPVMTRTWSSSFFNVSLIAASLSHWIPGAARRLGLGKATRYRPVPDAGVARVTMRPAAEADAASLEEAPFRLHKFKKNIGEERYRITWSGSSA
jgi:hypothetical protein